METSNFLLKEFDKTALHYDSVAHLPRIIGQRLLERLDELSCFTPTHILDLGCGTGFCLQLLKKRYPTSRLVGIDWSFPLLQCAQKATQTGSHQIELIQGDIQTLSFLTHAFDLIVANLSLLWACDLAAYLQQLKQHINPGGVLLFTLFGPDTFEPFRGRRASYPWGFSDLHTLGNVLVTKQWNDVVIDVDRFITEYDNRMACYEELQQLGLHTLFAQGERLAHPVDNRLETPYQVTWEIIYAKAAQIDSGSDRVDSKEVAIPIHQLFRKDEQ